MPKYKVLIGTVRHNDIVVEKGNSFELSETQAKQLLAEGVVELVKEEPKPKPKAKAKPKAKSEAKKKAPKEEVKPKAEPSKDWTRKELVEHAKKSGVVAASDKWSKAKLLEAIKKAQEPVKKGGDKK